MVAAALAFATWGAVPALAQQNAPPVDQSDASQPESDPPSRAARLSYIEGSVSLQPAGVEDWNAAPLNQPLTVGDALWIDSGSHAELDLGSAVVRLDGGSSLAVLDLSDRAVQLRLNAGTMDISVSGLDPAAVFELDAPNAAVALLRTGEYRLSVDNAGNTSVAVRNGQAQVVSSDEQSMNLLTGQRGLYSGSGYALAQAGPPDDFDRWCQRRQARWAESQAVTQYVSSDVVGYEDLNDYGQWQQEPDDGYVWFPTQVAADWVPYGAGHWAWVAPWGWSWVDDAPWGFAPFHYGRWTYMGQRWGWVPAPPRRHAVYAPALVAWIGGPTAGAALSLGGGAAVGWLPLAPGEVYVPAYRVSPRYLQNVNISNSSSLNPAYVTNVSRNPALQDRYANRAAPRALTVVPQINFTAGQPVARHVIAPPPQFQSATPMARVPGIVPGRESVLGAVSLGRVARPPPALMNRAVVTHRQPPPASPRFEQQQPAILANGGHPLDAVQLQRLRGPGAPADAKTPSPAAATTARRGIPERSPQFQPPAQSMGPNVFAQRDQELQQQRETQMREQLTQDVQQQRLKQQQLQVQQQQQQQRQTQAQHQEAQHQEAQRQELQSPSPPQHPKPEIKRPEPPPPAEQR
jgi:hypothetical protein